jgi:hypothetical protein
VKVIGNLDEKRFCKMFEEKKTPDWCELKREWKERN